MQSKRTIDLHDCNFVHMVAWKSVFLLQCRETNEVCYWLPILQQMAKMGAPREETDVM
jgi:hypothetical protein